MKTHRVPFENLVMKTLLSLIVTLCLWAGSVNAQPTPVTVLFATQFFSGQALNNPIVVTALNTPYSIQTGLVAGSTATLQPTNGVAVTNLFPGDYGVTIQGTLKQFVITVPQTNGVVVAAQSLKAGVSGLDVWLWTNTIPFTLVNGGTAITNPAGYLGVDGTLSFTNANGYVQVQPGGLFYAYEIRAGEPGTDTPPGAGIIRGLFFGDGSHITNFPGLTYNLKVLTNGTDTATAHFTNGILMSVTAP